MFLGGLSLGASHSMVLKQDGSVWTTGFNDYGQLGDKSNVARSSFVEVITGGVKAVAAGYSHSMALKQDGSVWATGYNKYGQLGDGTASNKRSFVKVFSGQ